MKIRIAVVIGLLIGAGSGIGSAQAIRTSSLSGTGDWGCAVVRPINQGICFENPLPEQLPQPSVPSPA